MMGTVGELPQAPKEKVVFMEDMSDSQLAATVSKLDNIRVYSDVKKQLLSSA